MLPLALLHECMEIPIWVLLEAGDCDSVAIFIPNFATSYQEP